MMWLLAAYSVVGGREACRARHISKMVLSIVKSGPPNWTPTDHRAFGNTTGPALSLVESTSKQPTLLQYFIAIAPYPRDSGVFSYLSTT